MALARVRGCAGQALLATLVAGGSIQQADASRRRNGPRKATFRRPITVRLRSKSCLAEGPDGLRHGRRSGVAPCAASASGGDCGGEGQVGGGGASPAAAAQIPVRRGG